MSTQPGTAQLSEADKTHTPVEHNHLDGHATHMYTTSQMGTIQSTAFDNGFYGNPRDMPHHNMQQVGNVGRIDMDRANMTHGLRSYNRSPYPMNGFKPNESPTISHEVRNTNANYLATGRAAREDSPPDPDDEVEDDEEADLDDADDSALDAGTNSKPFNKKNLKRHSETRFLLNEFVNNPHPDAAQRGRLAKQVTGLSSRQIQVWFQNRRAKLKRMSAPDAERLLNSRSYPEGYGPAGFNSGHTTSSRESSTSSPYMQPVEGVYASQMSSPVNREQVIFNNSQRNSPQGMQGHAQQNGNFAAPQTQESKRRSYGRNPLPQPIYAPPYNAAVSDQRMPNGPHTPRPMPGLTPYAMHGRPMQFAPPPGMQYARPYNAMAFPPRQVPCQDQSNLPLPYFPGRTNDGRQVPMEEQQHGAQQPLQNFPQIPMLPQQQLQQQAYPHAMYGGMMTPVNGMHFQRTDGAFFAPNGRPLPAPISNRQTDQNGQDRSVESGDGSTQQESMQVSFDQSQAALQQAQETETSMDQPALDHEQAADPNEQTTEQEQVSKDAADSS